LKFIRYFTILLGSLALVFADAGADSTETIEMETTTVTGKRLEIGNSSAAFGRDRAGEIISRNGFSLIRKGAFFAQDIYADGMKKSDINVTIDGERFPNACPNRMDSPITRINTFEMEAVDLNKNSCGCGSGLGGSIDFKREAPAANRWLKGGVSQSAGAHAATDLGLAANYANHKINLRYAYGNTYRDGEGNEYTDLYNYTDNFAYNLTEVYLQGDIGIIDYGIGLSVTRDITFPYLKMDERTNDLYYGYIRYGEHKLYANYTWHLMDNALRTGPMLMESDATNFTVGLTNGSYEVWYRNWNLDNFFDNPGQFYIDNHMIPDLHQYNGAYAAEYDYGRFQMAGRLGLSYIKANDADRISDFHQLLYRDAKNTKMFALGALSIATYFNKNSQLPIGLMAEFVRDQPDIEAMYVGVQKPGTNPWWVGNPTLNQPNRLTLRSTLQWQGLYVEGYGSIINDYVYPAKTSTEVRNYQTFTNVDATLIGFNLQYRHPYVDTEASYTYAENRDDGNALAEIPPLRLAVTLKSPSWNKLNARLKGSWNAKQNRYDEDLNELPSEAWARLDFTLIYEANAFAVQLDIDNLTNARYYQYLSFARNPFAAGSTVWDPGRVFRLSLILNKLSL
jgi:iron complex outermembrane receptor protein